MIRRSQAANGSAVRVRRFIDGNGTWSFFADDPVYTTVGEARRAWPRVRREAWAGTRYGRVPAAAEEYDGLTRTGFDLLWHTWQQQTFPAVEVRAALATDLAAVARFRASDARVTRDLDPYLTLWLDYLDQLTRIAEAIAAQTDRWKAGYAARLTQGSQFTYETILAGGFNLTGASDVD